MSELAAARARKALIAMHIGKGKTAADAEELADDALGVFDDPNLFAGLEGAPAAPEVESTKRELEQLSAAWEARRPELAKEMSAANFYARKPLEAEWAQWTDALFDAKQRAGAEPATPTVTDLDRAASAAAVKALRGSPEFAAALARGDSGRAANELLAQAVEAAALAAEAAPGGAKGRSAWRPRNQYGPAWRKCSECSCAPLTSSTVVMSICRGSRRRLPGAA